MLLLSEWESNPSPQIKESINFFKKVAILQAKLEKIEGKLPSPKQQPIDVEIDEAALKDVLLDCITDEGHALAKPA